MQIFKTLILITLSFCACSVNTANDDVKISQDMPNLQGQTPNLTQWKNPLGRLFGDINNIDPLGLGDMPRIPQAQENPSLIDGDSLVPSIPSTPPKPLLQQNGSSNDRLNPQAGLTSPVFGSASFVSDSMVIMGAGGEVLTIWALARGNWIWGYSLIDSKTFGDARIWQLIIYPKNFVQIKNLKTESCLNAYGNGIIHSTCDVMNRAQFWELKLMNNGATQIKNLATQSCIQSPIDNILGDFNKVFSIYTAPCDSGDNFDQQWYFIAPPVPIKPLYGLN